MLSETFTSWPNTYSVRPAILKFRICVRPCEIVRIPVAVDRHAVQSDVVSREKLNDIVKNTHGGSGRASALYPHSVLFDGIVRLSTMKVFPEGKSTFVFAVSAASILSLSSVAPSLLHRSSSRKPRPHMQ
jgi:hypothetical protein